MTIVRHKDQFSGNKGTFATITALYIKTVQYLRYKDQKLGDRGSRYNESLLYLKRLFCQLLLQRLDLCL